MTYKHQGSHLKIIQMILIIWYEQTFQTRSEQKKKSSKSGGAKKAIGLLRKEQPDTILCFLGAGGHVWISGIRNLSAFGVEHALVEISTLSKSKPESIFEHPLQPVEELEGKSSIFVASFMLFGLITAVFLYWVFLSVLLLLVVSAEALFLPVGAILLVSAI